ncbi:hypothetical protein ACFSHQ_24395 [Gemmobacter lanyuensis]
MIHALFGPSQHPIKGRVILAKIVIGARHRRHCRQSQRPATRIRQRRGAGQMIWQELPVPSILLDARMGVEPLLSQLLHLMMAM